MRKGFSLAEAETFSLQYASFLNVSMIIPGDFLYVRISLFLDHMERKVPKYENHKIRERKVKR